MKTIVIDGVDGSGKQTQTTRLAQNLTNKGYKVKLVSFPRYDDTITEPVNRYLNGDYGKKAEDVNPYASSLFYIMDRLDYFLKEDLSDVDILICDRYSTSNLIHQGSKIKDLEDRNNFDNWLLNLEYNVLNLPKPDQVFYLSLPTEVTEELIEQRQNETDLDIHEKDINYQKLCVQRTNELTEKFNWEIINCSNRNSIRSIESIQEELLNKVLEILNE